MTSHEYAKDLRRLAEFLEGKGEFELGDYKNAQQCWFYYTDKEKFLTAVRALGAGRKEWTEEELKFHPHELLTLYVQRSAVCKLVSPAKYDCEPLLSQAEVAELDAVSGGEIC